MGRSGTKCRSRGQSAARAEKVAARTPGGMARPSLRAAVPLYFPHGTSTETDSPPLVCILACGDRRGRLVLALADNDPKEVRTRNVPNTLPTPWPPFLGQSPPSLYPALDKQTGRTANGLRDRSQALSLRPHLMHALHVDLHGVGRSGWGGMRSLVPDVARTMSVKPQLTQHFYICRFTS
jgi:hypothetical protein